VFTFEIPIEWRDTILPVPDMGDALESTRVLVVDDEPAITEYFAEVLNGYYISVDTAGSGEEALELARKAAESNRPYNIAFIDWRLPGISGAETSTRLYATLPECKVIVISGSDWVDIREHFNEGLSRNQIIDFMPKPIPPSDIYDRVIKTLHVDMASANYSDFAGKRILLVEDVEVNRIIVTAMMEDSGCIIDEAENGQLGVELAEKNDYDLILMDMQMPVMDGLSATRAIRQFNQQVPIIAMTANAFREDAEACLEAGMNAHITKPIDNEIFMRTMYDYLNGEHKK
jgi:CheY-like chemotaxis protein